MTKSNATHQHILRVADEMFSTKGYKSVRLREVAQVVGLKHTAIYYYAASKEDLYVQVMEQNFKRHQHAMEEAIARTNNDIRAQMKAVASWLMSQTPMHLGRMIQSDFAELRPENAARLNQLIFDSMRLPLEKALLSAQEQHIIETNNPGLAAISFISLMETVHSMQFASSREEKESIADTTIDIFLNGLLAR
ncbi:MAG: hypothetical protein GFH27_549347n8 [Chloroflexi bacterium AL-W]|nr:hypothetical protein [Chloroflexi bacterium AL-N1]NOK70790.1 hypothetical protein [Chloroflexi bacterium AL-N10]NOK78350.1 hypothetical protein [Chloroflexi bacterium AL-N5]NOK85331.1 hypothetical protein [Chloroflexi bacterium AL-W]NOK92607.1 hypothetical protein [Chloroflexi bacterium AL-N15]